MADDDLEEMKSLRGNNHAINAHENSCSIMLCSGCPIWVLQLLSDYVMT